MSMNCMLALVPRTEAGRLGDFTEPAVTFDAASSLDASAPSAAQVGEHVLLVGPQLDPEQVPALADPDAGAAIVALGGTSDVYMFTVMGREQRLRVVAEGATVEDSGTPVAAETAFDEIVDPEDAHLAVLCALAGITPPDLFALAWRPLGRPKRRFAGLFGRR